MMDLATLGIEASTLDMQSVKDMDLEDELEERRLGRIDNCGSWATRPNPSTGGYMSFQSKCGYWRRCPACYADRVAEFEARYVECLNQCGDNIRIVEGDRKLVRKLRRYGVEYWAIPTEDGITVVFEAAGDWGEEVIPDWEELAKTPLHTRVSGDLGKIVHAEEEYTTSYVIPVTVFIIKTDAVPLSAIIEEATKLTSELDPAFDEDELRFATYTMSCTLREVALRHGGTIVNENIVKVRVTDKSYRRWVLRNKATIDLPVLKPIPLQPAFWNTQ